MYIDVGSSLSLLSDRTSDSAEIGLNFVRWEVITIYLCSMLAEGTS